MLKPCQGWGCPSSKTIESLVSQWVPWLWVFNNLATVFSFAFILSTVIENGLMMCSGVLCSAFYSLHYVCPVGTALTGLGVSNGSVGIGLGTSPIKLDELLAPRMGACRDKVLHSPRCMLQRSAPVKRPFIRHDIPRFATVLMRSDKIYYMCQQG